jgi:diacylglycerol kinase family enzyme
VARRVAVVVNPSTRGVAATLITALEAACPPDTVLEIYRTTSRGQAVVLARLAAMSADIVVAAGGDGTVAEVATGIAGTASLLGIIPMGSTNITAQELGIPSRLADAATLLFGPHDVRRIDAGRCGDRRFLHMAGAGLDSLFFERTSRALKRRIGWLAYLPAATLALRQPAARFSVDVDGQSITVTSSLVVVANGGSIIAPVIRLHPDVRADDGWLDVLIFTATNPEAIARTVLRFLTGSLARSPYLVHRRGREVSLWSEPELPVQLDGDVVTRTPVTFTVEPLGIRVIAPLTPR